MYSWVGYAVGVSPCVQLGGEYKKLFCTDFVFVVDRAYAQLHTKTELFMEPPLSS